MSCTGGAARARLGELDRAAAFRATIAHFQRSTPVILRAADLVEQVIATGQPVRREPLAAAV